MLRTAGNPAADLVLRAVAEESRRTGALAALLGQDRVAFWETLSDLVQAGLVEHDPERDAVRGTAAGLAVVELIDRISEPGDGR
jgi:DNA-binding IclR family transcriptional regulator